MRSHFFKKNKKQLRQPVPIFIPGQMTHQKPTTKPYVIGHRGVMALAPENTIRSFQKALDTGCDVIEFDVMQCKSGEVVVFHDSSVERLTGVKRRLHRLTLSEIKELRLPEGETIPTLTDVLAFLNARIAINIEIKDASCVHAVCRIVDQHVRQYGWQWSQFILSSFQRKSLKKVRRYLPLVPVAVMMTHSSVGVFKFARKVQAASVHAHKRVMDRSLVKACHTRDLLVFVWTVNDQQLGGRLKTIGVDGFFTDDPTVL